MHLTFVPWDFFLILLFLGTIVPWRGAVRIKRLLGKPVLGEKERLSLYGTTTLYQWVLVAVVAWRASARGLTSTELGLTFSDPWRTMLCALVLTSLLCVNQLASLKRIARIPEMRDGLLFRIAEKIAPRTSPDFVAFAALACTAGLCEEFLYRGFLFAVFARLLANTALSLAGAAALSSLWFAIGHVYQGKRGLITTFVVGMLFSAVRIWSGNLIPSIVAHAGIDLIAGLFVSLSLNRKELVDADDTKA